MPPLPAKKPLRTRALVTQKEIEAIDKQHRAISAGDGYYFDGRNYISPTGDTLKFHPEIEMYISDFLEAENDKLREYNSNVATRRARMDAARRGEAAEDSKDLEIACYEEQAQKGRRTGANTEITLSQKNNHK